MHLFVPPFFKSLFKTAVLVDTAAVYAAAPTGTTISIPATAQAGDIAVLLQGSTAGSYATPAGFTAINSAVNGGNNIRTQAAYRILGAGEAGNALTGMAGTVNEKVILLFRPTFTVSAVSVLSQAAVVSGSTPSTQTISVTSGSAPVLLIGAAQGLDAGTLPTPSGNLPANGTVLSFNRLASAYEVQDRTLANRTIGMSSGGSTSGLMSFGLQLS